MATLPGGNRHDFRHPGSVLRIHTRLVRFPLLIRIALCVAAVLPLVAGVAVGPGSLVAAQSDGNGLAESSTNTFQIDETTVTVRVTVEIALRNVTPDTREGNQIRQTFFTSYGVVVPAGAENIVATRNDSTLDGELIVNEEGEPFSLYQFELGTRLFNGNSTSIIVTYDHTGQPPRSELLWRANAAYASFLAFGLGDSGSITINVVLPSGYEFDEFTDLEGFEASAPDEFDAVTYTRGDLDEEFARVISLSNDDLLTSTPLDVPGADLELRSWPDDPEWLAFATDKVESGVPELEELIGTPWPLDAAFDIRQTVEPNFLGYAGWFDTQASEIAVGEELDALTMYHELTHAWFNRDVFASRWLSEGFAELYAAEMIERDGDPRPEPRTPALSGLGRQPLSLWTNFSADDNTEEYGYNAAHFVMDAVADDIGFAAMGDVLAAVRSRQLAYPATPAATPPPGGSAAELDPEQRASTIIDWRRMLDYFEYVGGSTAADGVFREYVITDDDIAELAERSAAIESYDELAEQIAPWSMPVGIRKRMDIWAFKRATALQDEAADIIEMRSAIADLESTTGIDATAAIMADAADDFARTEDGFEAVAATLEPEIADGEALVEVQATIQDRGSLAGATPPALSALDGIDGFASTQPFADDQIAALDAVIGAAEAADSERSFTQKIGLWGTDVDSDVSAARTAIEAGDNDAALASTANALRTIDDADDLGASRLTKAAAAIVAFVLLLAIVVIVVVRRRRERRTLAAAQVTSATLATGATLGTGDTVPASSSGGVGASVGGELRDRDIDLDEDALAGAGLGRVDDIGDVALGDPGETARAAGIVERGTVLGDVRDPILELNEHIGTVIDTDPVTGAQVLVNPDTHDGDDGTSDS